MKFNQDQLIDIAILDATGKLPIQVLRQDLYSQGYNLVAVAYSVDQALALQASIDKLIVYIDDDVDSACNISGAVVDTILMVNPNIAQALVLSPKRCTGAEFDYVAAEPINYDIFQALKLTELPHKSALDLSLQNFRHLAETILLNIGFKMTHKGFKQLIYASYICMFGKADLYAKAYSYAAGRTGTNVQAVERNIRSCIAGASATLKSLDQPLKLCSDLQNCNVTLKTLQPLIDAINCGKNKAMIVGLADFVWDNLF